MKYNHVATFSLILESHNENLTNRELKDLFLRTILNIDDEEFDSYVEISKDIEETEIEESENI